MANEEHLKRLEQGVTQWNTWRNVQPGIRPDLSGADLSGAHLSHANLSFARLDSADLSHANLSDAHLNRSHLNGAHLNNAVLHSAHLSYANLSGADLRNADLSGAYLDHANLSDADLRNAHFRNADLSGANLSRADLSDAQLTRADFNRAVLDGANLSGATVGWTPFINVDLSSVKGLESVIHGGPSSIGIDTIYRSQGNIPEVFLEGAGVDDTSIAYIRSLIGIPIEYYSCFISYSSKDEDFAKRLHADLQSNGVRCWFAPEDMKIGDKIRPRIDEAIRIHDKLLLVLSEHSVESAWVEKEVETAFERERLQNRLVLFPIRLDDCIMQTTQAWAADIRRTRHIGDFTKWKDHDEYQKSFNRLLRDLKAEA